MKYRKSWGFPGGSDGKESACNAGDLGSIPGLERSPGEGHGNPLQYSCLENPHGQRSLAGSSVEWGRVGHDSATKHSTQGGMTNKWTAISCKFLPIKAGKSVEAFISMMYNQKETKVFSGLPDLSAWMNVQEMLTQGAHAAAGSTNNLADRNLKVKADLSYVILSDPPKWCPFREPRMFFLHWSFETLISEKEVSGWSWSPGGWWKVLPKPGCWMAEVKFRWGTPI